jgi:hypothetical protein
LEDKFIKVPNTYIDGEDVLEADKLFLLVLLFQSKSSRDICTFSVRQLCTRLNTTTGNTNRTKYIINTLKYFQEKQILFFSDEYDCSNEINIEEYTTKSKIDLYYADEYIDKQGTFTMLYDKEFNKIINYCNNNKVDKYLMLNLFLYIIKKINNNEKDEDYKLCYPSIQKIAEVLKISETTVLKYIKILRDDIELLYYDNVGYKIVNGKYKETNIFYSKMEDKDYVIQRIKKEQENKSITSIDKPTKNKLNQKRSLKQKINILIKKINKTSEENNKLIELQNQYKELNKQK